MLLRSSGATLPAGIEPVFKALGQASLPLGLLCVGAALDYSAICSWLQAVFIYSIAKFVLMPLASVAACHANVLHGSAALAALLLQTTSKA